MTKTTWTAQTKSQLVAALARKGYDRTEVRRAADRAVENGFAWAWGRDAGERAMALVTFSDTEVDMWDASLHTEAEVSCNVCNTMAHAPATLTQVEGIGNACRNCHRQASTKTAFDTYAEFLAGRVAEGKLAQADIDERLTAIRKLADALGVDLADEPAAQAEVGHYAREIASGLIVFVLAEAPEFGTIEVRHNDGTTGWGGREFYAPMTEDEELSAAITYGLATGQLVDAADWLAQQEADEAARLAFEEWQQDEAAQAEHEAAGPDHATWCAGPMAHVVEFAACGVCLTRQPAASMTRDGSEFVCSDCSPAT